MHAHCFSRTCLGLAAAAFAALGFHTAATAQTFTEYTIPTTIVTPNANSITPGPDGALWFTESGGNRIGRITTGGTITEFAIPTSNAFPFTITAGPDGALWFTEQDLNATKIGRITTAGAITEFSVPTASSQPTGIAAGSDGALWFTEANRNKIGRITTAGTITEFTLPGSFGTNRPFGITAGPDGALWYTVTGTNKIGRITTSGTVTEFALPNGNSGVNYITTGPDGALWFTEQGAAPHRIGRMTTAGAVTEFPLPTTNGSPQAITTGPDGALWFAEGNLGQVGRISTSGTVKEFRSPGGGGTPTGAARGPDGNMWFTNGFKILKLPPPAATSTLVSSTLPVSRSVQVGKTATAFASIINTGSAAVSGCGIVPITPVPAAFVYQTTDPKTNALTGTINTPASIAAGGVQTYLVAFTANAPFVPTDVVLGYSCTGVDAVVTIVGINTLLLTFDANPVPDVVAVGLTPTNDGFSHTGGSAGTGLFAIATSNVGTGGALTTRVRLSDTTLPIGATLCQTNSTGGCLAPPSATVTGTVAANANQTFSVFLQANGSVGADPARFRCFLEFVDGGGVVRGSTSTAVTTQ